MSRFDFLLVEAAKNQPPKKQNLNLSQKLAQMYNRGKSSIVLSHIAFAIGNTPKERKPCYLSKSLLFALTWIWTCLGSRCSS